tara:strand:+ start:544 stop:849 length:306 start_codon:yes stop_codon:yes gene_type:complete
MTSHPAFTNSTVIQYNNVPTALSGSSSASLATSLFGGAHGTPNSLTSKTDLNLLQYYKKPLISKNFKKPNTTNSSSILGGNAWLISGYLNKYGSVLKVNKS